jgi:hypothetical protein
VEPKKDERKKQVHQFSAAAAKYMTVAVYIFYSYLFRIVEGISQTWLVSFPPVFLIVLFLPLDFMVR